MKTHRRTHKPAEFRWPPKPTLTFYNGRGQVLFTETDSEMDLFDAVMFNWGRPSRLIYLGIRSHGRSWSTGRSRACSMLNGSSSTTLASTAASSQSTG